MGIRKLPSGSYQARIKIDGKPLAKTFPSMDAAQNWIDSFEAPALHTIAALSSDYLREVMTVNGKQRGGYESIYYKLQALDRGFNGKSLDAITREHVISYRNSRVHEVSGSTVRLELQLLSRFLRWAESEKGVMCGDVTEGVKLPVAGKARDKVIEPLQYSMILENASEKSKPIITLAWETAMRRNEILAVTPAMIDFRKKVICLSDEMTKNGEGRDVPLSKAAVALLTELCEGRDKNARLFNLTPYAVTQAFRRAARLSGVTGVCFHSLRHSAITRYAEKGLNTIQLQCISGHKSIAMLARYSHIKATTVADLMD